MNKQRSAPSGTPQFTGRVRSIRDLPIWTKLGLIMIVPTLATLVVGTWSLLDQVGKATDVERARSLTMLSGEGGNLVQALQEERAAAVKLLTATGEEVVAQLTTDYAARGAATDSARANYEVSRETLADLPSNLNHLLASVEDGLAGLKETRKKVTVPSGVPLTVAESQYSQLVEELLQIRDHVSQLASDATLADRVSAADAVATEKEFVSQERVIVAKALADHGFSLAAQRMYIGTIQGQNLAQMSFARAATPEQSARYDEMLSPPEADDPATEVDRPVRDSHSYEGSLDSLTNGRDPTEVVPPDAWDAAMAGRGEIMFEFEKSLNQDALETATALGEQVRGRVLTQTGVLLLTLLLGILFAWLVARSMARSLRDLRQGALAVANFGLPQAVSRLRDPALTAHLSPEIVAVQIAEPLPVRSKDEFGQVTEAFNAVHLEAVRTAAEQAALRASVATMFVNLARRSQILVDRLIGHLDRLERGEEDPDRLSELFQLDHLATRMRRNDENLLVLAGFDSTRVQREPASLMDVLRAAQSEVEHYTRIEFAIVDSDIEIGAHAVNDMVHLVAELFDNATAFSPPDTSIRVEARRRGERAVLQVEDHGIGMSPEQYAELNHRLSTPPEVDVAVSRMMGLVVVARLATRHAVKVEVRPARERGTLAEVIIPANVLVPRAMAGRAHAPAGFPAARPAPPNGPLLFPPPLALESGPSTSMSDETQPAAAWSPVSPYPGPSGAVGPGAVGSGAVGPGAVGSGFGGEPGFPGVPGVAAAFGAPVPAGGARRGPAWADLAGVPGETETDRGGRGGEAGPDLEQLPRRRPTGLWGDAESAPAPTQPDAAGTGEARSGSGVASSSVPAPAASSYPPLPSRYSAAPSGAGGAPPPPGTPPSWPLAAGGAAPGAAGPPRDDQGIHADDLTVELPIFQELESAWFRPGEPKADAQPPAPGGWSSDGGAWAGDGASGGRAASATETGDRPGSSGAPGGLPYPAGSGYGAGQGSPDSPWRTLADDGWRAAEAALHPTDGGTTRMGLPRRVPMAQLVPGGVDEVAARPTERRTPEAVRGTLSAYTDGVQRGRGAHSRYADTADSSPTSGKEQES